MDRQGYARVAAAVTGVSTLEQLEARRMLSGGSVAVRDGTLVVTGTRGNDVIEVRRANSPVPSEGFNVDTRPWVSVRINAVEQGPVQASEVRGILIHGGRGRDRVEADTAFAATIMGGRGNDTLIGGPHNDVIYGHAGRDSIDARYGKDQVFGGSGSDTLSGGADDDRLMGGSGNDVISSDEGDQVQGGRGTDAITQSDGSRDTAPTGRPPNFELAADGTLTVHGTDDADVITVGYIGRDTYTTVPVTNSYYFVYVNGDASGPIPETQVRRIRIFAGGGNDHVSAGYEGQIADASETDLPVTIMGGSGDDTLTGGNGNDLVDGEDGDDEVIGSEGDDVVIGGAGRDTLRGNEGKDSLRGGDGDDYVSGGAGGDDSVWGDGGNDVFVTVDDAVAKFKDKRPGEITTDLPVYGPRDEMRLLPEPSRPAGTLKLFH